MSKASSTRMSRKAANKTILASPSVPEAEPTAVVLHSISAAFDTKSMVAKDRLTKSMRRFQEQGAAQKAPAAMALSIISDRHSGLNATIKANLTNSKRTVFTGEDLCAVRASDKILATVVRQQDQQICSLETRLESVYREHGLSEEEIREDLMKADVAFTFDCDDEDLLNLLTHAGAISPQTTIK